MSRAIRFHLDENVDPAVAAGLRRHGIDVTTSQQARLLAASDPTQLAYARDAGRVLVTHDGDHLRLHALGERHAGIAYCYQGKLHLGGLITALVLLFEVYDPAEMADRVEYL
ncbi:MAG: hypothetical protein BGO49_05100 [Planctomycetales bacterium 71-10]|nr:MAG: hypothetical protein BGO49_05100 [Planctomycetales bacterium 71-10]